MPMSSQFYMSGEEVRLGDLVEISHGNGPKATIVVLIPEGPAAAGFKAEEWSYLKSGFMLQAEGMGLVHYSEPDNELLLIRRA